MVWKRFAMLAYVFLAVFIVSVTMSGAVTYQNNIYTAIPFWGWAGFVVAIGVGTLLWYHGLRQRSRSVLGHSIGILALTFGVFWIFPQLLGLPFWSAPRSDLLQHYGQSKAIVATGHTVINDIYPAIHILLAYLHTLTGLPYSVLGPILTFTYYWLFIGSLAIVARRFSNPLVGGYVFFAGLPMYFGVFVHHLTPWMAYFALIPLLILLSITYTTSISKKQRIFIGIGTIIFAGGLAVGHPMSSIVGYFVIFLLAISRRIGEALLENVSKPRSILSPYLLLPVIIAYPIWYLSQVTFRRFLHITVLSFVSPGVEGTAKLAGEAGSSGYTVLQLVYRYLILRWGSAILVFILSGIIAAVISYRILRRRATVNEGSLIVIYGFGISIAGIMLFANLIAKGPIRTNQVTIASGIVLIGVGVWWITERTESRPSQVGRAILIGIITIAVVGTPFAIFDTKSHITDRELVGTHHHLEHSNHDIPTYADSMSPLVTVYIRGSHRSFNHHNPVFSRFENQPPKYLGYHMNRTIGRSISDDRFYLITKNRDMEWWKQEPPNRYSHIRFYTAENHSQLQGDSTVHKVYSNDGFWIWLSSTE